MDESNYSRTMNIARKLFRDYDPRNKDIGILASLGKELL
jgi:hypothetical protein